MLDISAIHIHRTRPVAIILLVLAVDICAGCHTAHVRSPQQIRASELISSHCARAGVRITRTVENVEGIFVMKVRPKGINFGDQFKLDDPYGADLHGEGYLGEFLRENHDVMLQPEYHRAKAALVRGPIGFSYVDAINPIDGRRYRYTGRVTEPWQTNKHYLKGYFKFFVDAVPAVGPSPRYAVTFDDISTSEDRSLWIAGSLLKVIDQQTNEIIAERIGYMYDPSQGGTPDGRSPWLYAANFACPSFGAGPHASSWQTGQTARFVEQVLHPTPAVAH